MKVSECFSDAPPISTATYKQQAYALLKDAILYRRLKVGQVYSQDGICNEFGISRTPVREALLELQKEGYINFRRGRGIEVVPITSKEAEEIVEMRAIIELAGSELAARRASPYQVARLLECLDEMRRHAHGGSSAELYKLDRQFHMALFESAGNKRLLDTVEMLRDQFLRFETLDAFSTPEKYNQVLEEHAGIYEAIAAGNPARAKEAMQRHLDCTYRRTVKRALESDMFQ